MLERCMCVFACEYLKKMRNRERDRVSERDSESNPVGKVNTSRETK